MEGKTQQTAAAAAGMSERSARKWETGPLPSETKEPRTWRTRLDPFAEVWERDLVPLLERDDQGVLQATTLMEVLQERYGSRFPDGQVRTLQRRLRDWRAIHGPEKEVFFEQVHIPGREAAIDFTHGTELGVTVRGALFVHLPPWRKAPGLGPWDISHPCQGVMRGLGKPPHPHGPSGVEPVDVTAEQSRCLGVPVPRGVGHQAAEEGAQGESRARVLWPTASAGSRSE